MKNAEYLALGLAVLAVFFTVRAKTSTPAAPAASAGSYDAQTWQKAAELWGAGGSPAAWAAAFPYSETGL